MHSPTQIWDWCAPESALALPERCHILMDMLGRNACPSSGLAISTAISSAWVAYWVTYWYLGAYGMCCPVSEVLCVLTGSKDSRWLLDYLSVCVCVCQGVCERQEAPTNIRAAPPMWAHDLFAKQDPSDKGYHCGMFKDEEEGWQCSSGGRMFALYTQRPEFSPQDCIKTGLVEHARNPTTWEDQKFITILDYTVSLKMSGLHEILP